MNGQREGLWRTCRKLFFAVLVVAALAVLAYRSRGQIHIGEFNWAKLVGSVAGTRIVLLVASVATVYVAFVLRALRWKGFSRPLGSTMFLDVYGALLMGFSALFLLGRAGEPVAPLLLARKTRLPASSMFGIYVLERLFDLAATAVLAGLGLIFFPGVLTTDGSDLAWESRMRTTGEVLLLGLVGLIVMLVYFRMHGAGMVERRLLASWREMSGWRRRVAEHFSGFSGGLLAIRTFSDLLAALFYTAAHWGMLAFTFLLVMHSFGGLLEQINFPGAMLILAFTMVGSTLQFPGVGGGAQVASFIALTRLFRIAEEPAAAAAIVLWLISFASPCLVGVPLMIKEGWSMGDLRRLARAKSDTEKAVPISSLSGTNGG